MPSMQIEVRGSGVRELAAEFRASAEAGRVLLRSIERMPNLLQDTAAGYELIRTTSRGITWGASQQSITRLERYSAALLDVAAGYELVAVARERAGLEGAAALTSPSIRTATVRPVNRSAEREAPTTPAETAEELRRRTSRVLANRRQSEAGFDVREFALPRPEPLTPPRKPVVSGIYQEREKLLGQRDDVYGRGSAAEQRDYERRLREVSRRIRREEQPEPGFGQLLLEAVGTSRFGAGSIGGIELSPLVNRFGSLLAGGSEGLAGGASGALVGGGVLLALGLAKTGVEAFGKALNESVVSLREHRAALIQSGGGSGTISQLTAYGLQPGQIAGLGDQLRQRLSPGSGDAYALMAGARAGIGPQLDPRLGGSQDNAKLVSQAMEYLYVVREQAGAERQLLEARRLGLEGLLDTINVSREVHDAQRRDAEVRRTIYTPEQLQAARDYAANQERLRANWELLKVGLTAGATRNLGDASGFLADQITAGKTTGYHRPGGIGWRLGEAGVTALFGEENRRRWFGDGRPTQSAPKTDTDRVVGKLDEIKGVLKEGFLRSGPEAMQALPPGLRQEALRQSLKDGSIRRKTVNLG